MLKRVALLLLLSTTALAAPPEGADPALAPWFRSLLTPNGTSCCDITDCRNYNYRTTAAGYEVDYNGTWLPVAPEAVLPRYDNPTGRAVACVFGGRVMCFVRGTEV